MYSKYLLNLKKLHLLQNNINSNQGVVSANSENNLHIFKGQELNVKEINDSLVVGEDSNNGIGFLEKFVVILILW